MRKFINLLILAMILFQFLLMLLESMDFLKNLIILNGGKNFLISNMLSVVIKLADARG
ncbi:MAG: hypothetical protein ABDH19_08335 [Thermodesulfovibrio sp.]